MSERVERFEIEGRPSVSLRLPTGDVRIARSEGAEVVVSVSGSERDLERLRIERNGRHIVVEVSREGGFRFRLSSMDIEIALPDDSELEVRVASGDLRIVPDLHSVSVDTASGDVFIEGRVGRDLSIKSASGDIRVAAVDGRLDASLASGDLKVAEIGGDCRIVAASGDIRIGRIGGGASFKTAAGDIAVGRFEGDQFDAKSMSGDVLIKVPSGRKYDVAFRTLSGDVRTAFPVSAGSSGAPARLSVSSMSGDITVRGAD